MSTSAALRERPPIEVANDWIPVRRAQPTTPQRLRLLSLPVDGALVRPTRQMVTRQFDGEIEVL